MRNSSMDPLLLQQLLSAATSSSSSNPIQQQQLQQMLLGSLAASIATPSTSTVAPENPQIMAHPGVFDMNLAALQQMMYLQQCAMQNSPAISPTVPFLPLSCHPLLNPAVPVSVISSAPTSTTSTTSLANSVPSRKPSNHELSALQALTLQIGQPTSNQSQNQNQNQQQNQLIGCATPPEIFSISSLLNMTAQHQHNLEHSKSPKLTKTTFDKKSILDLLNSTNVNANGIDRKLSGSTPVSASPIAVSRPSITMADVIPMICPPVLTPNGSVPASSPSTSQSSISSKNADKEDDDEDMFVDVESIDVAIDGKDRRKAHVEFYRKIKSMRQREKVLTCAICKKKVENVENTIQTHVNEHADAGVYQCRICGWQSNDKYRIYEHMRQEHPGKVEKFQDKRDMPKMCQMMIQCFPRPNSRPKKESDRSSDIYLSDVVKLMDKRGFNSLDCVICKTAVRKEKQAIIRHVQNSHTLKCKTCKIITVTIDEQLEHQRDCHAMSEPKMSVHYAPSAAAVFLLPALEKCFPIPA